MERLSKLVVLVAVVLMVGQGAFALPNLVFNSGFEVAEGGGANGDDDAMYWGNDNGVQGERQNTVVHSGDWAVELYDYTPGGYPRINQILNMDDGQGGLIDIGGKEVTASVWGTHDGITSPFANAYLTLAFYTGSGAWISSVEQWSLNSTFTPYEWVEISIATIAPAGAQKIEVLLIGNDPAGGAGGSFYFDDASLTVPEPMTMGLLGLGSLALLRKRKVS